MAFLVAIWIMVLNVLISECQVQKKTLHIEILPLSLIAQVEHLYHTVISTHINYKCSSTLISNVTLDEQLKHLVMYNIDTNF